MKAKVQGILWAEDQNGFEDPEGLEKGIKYEEMGFREEISHYFEVQFTDTHGSTAPGMRLHGGRRTAGRVPDSWA